MPSKQEPRLMLLAALIRGFLHEVQNPYCNCKDFFIIIIIIIPLVKLNVQPKP